MNKEIAFRLFIESGNIEAFLLYKELELLESKTNILPNEICISTAV